MCQSLTDSRESAALLHANRTTAAETQIKALKDLCKSLEKSKQQLTRQLKDSQEKVCATFYPLHKASMPV